MQHHAAEYKIALPECVDEPFRFMCGQEASIQLNDCYSIENVMEGVCRYYREGKDEDYANAQIEFGFAQIYLEMAHALKQE